MTARSPRAASGEFLPAVEAWCVDHGVEATGDLLSTGEKTQEGPQAGHHVLEERSADAPTHGPHERLDLLRAEAPQDRAISVETEEREQLRGGGAVLRGRPLRQPAHPVEVRPVGRDHLVTRRHQGRCEEALYVEVAS